MENGYDESGIGKDIATEEIRENPDDLDVSGENRYLEKNSTEGDSVEAGGPEMFSVEEDVEGGGLNLEEEKVVHNRLPTSGVDKHFDKLLEIDAFEMKNAENHGVEEGVEYDRLEAKTSLQKLRVDKVLEKGGLEKSNSDKDRVERIFEELGLKESEAERDRVETGLENDGPETSRLESYTVVRYGFEKSDPQKVIAEEGLENDGLETSVDMDTVTKDGLEKVNAAKDIEEQGLETVEEAVKDGSETFEPNKDGGERGLEEGGLENSVQESDRVENSHKASGPEARSLENVVVANDGLDNSNPEKGTVEKGSENEVLETILPEMDSVDKNLEKDGVERSNTDNSEVYQSSIRDKAGAADQGNASFEKISIQKVNVLGPNIGGHEDLRRLENFPITVEPFLVPVQKPSGRAPHYNKVGRPRKYAKASAGQPPMPRPAPSQIAPQQQQQPQQLPQQAYPNASQVTSQHLNMHQIASAMMRMSGNRQSSFPSFPPNILQPPLQNLMPSAPVGSHHSSPPNLMSPPHLGPYANVLRPPIITGMFNHVDTPPNSAGMFSHVQPPPNVTGMYNHMDPAVNVPGRFNRVENPAHILARFNAENPANMASRFNHMENPANAMGRFNHVENPASLPGMVNHGETPASATGMLNRMDNPPSTTNAGPAPVAAANNEKAVHHSDSPDNKSSSSSDSEKTDKSKKRKRGVGQGKRRGGNWTDQEMEALIEAKRMEHIDDLGLSAKARAACKPEKWNIICATLKENGYDREVSETKSKWRSILKLYRRIRRWQEKPGVEDYFQMTRATRQRYGLRQGLSRDIYYLLDDWIEKDDAVNLPNSGKASPASSTENQSLDRKKTKDRRRSEKAALKKKKAAGGAAAVESEDYIMEKFGATLDKSLSGAIERVSMHQVERLKALVTSRHDNLEGILDRVMSKAVGEFTLSMEKLLRP